MLCALQREPRALSLSPALALSFFQSLASGLNVKKSDEGRALVIFCKRKANKQKKVYRNEIIAISIIITFTPLITRRCERIQKKIIEKMICYLRRLVKFVAL